MCSAILYSPIASFLCFSLEINIDSTSNIILTSKMSDFNHPFNILCCVLQRLTTYQVWHIQKVSILTSLYVVLWGSCISVEIGRFLFIQENGVDIWVVFSVFSLFYVFQLRVKRVKIFHIKYMSSALTWPLTVWKECKLAISSSQSPWHLFIHQIDSNYIGHGLKKMCIYALWHLAF